MAPHAYQRGNSEASPEKKNPRAKKKDYPARDHPPSVKGKNSPGTGKKKRKAKTTSEEKRRNVQLCTKEKARREGEH